MTVLAQVPEIGAVANGLTASFGFQFQVPTVADLYVTWDGLQRLGGFSVSGLGTGSGTVVFAPVPPAGTVVAIQRKTALIRATDYQQQGDFLAPIVNADFDRPLLILQELAAQSSRSIQVAVGDETTTLPPLAGNEGLVLGVLNGILQLISTPGSDGSALTALSSAAANKGSALVTYLLSAAGSVSRTLTNKLGEFVSVKDFGCVGDGVTDDTAALLRVVAYTNSGAGTRRVTWPNGQYVCKQPLVIDTDHAFTWVGDTCANQIFQYSPTILFDIADGTNGLVIQANSAAGYKSMTNVSNLFFQRKTLETQGGGGIGLTLLCCIGFNFDNCMVQGWDIGGRLDGITGKQACQNGSFFKCFFGNASTRQLQVQGATNIAFEQCYFGYSGMTVAPSEHIFLTIGDAVPVSDTITFNRCTLGTSSGLYATRNVLMNGGLYNSFTNCDIEQAEFGFYLAFPAGASSVAPTIRNLTVDNCWFDGHRTACFASAANAAFLLTHCRMEGFSCSASTILVDNASAVRMDVQITDNLLSFANTMNNGSAGISLNHCIGAVVSGNKINSTNGTPAVNSAAIEIGAGSKQNAITGNVLYCNFASSQPGIADSSGNTTNVFAGNAAGVA